LIQIKDLSIDFGSFHLRDVNLSIKSGEFFVFLGPTGAGKTVLIECIAGLHRLKKGQIWAYNEDISFLPPDERGMGYVPQDYKLFPHLNVFGNISFGLKIKKYSPQQIDERVRYISEIIGISHLLQRDTYRLSCGEKQRVALARALAPFYKVLLLDEPMTNLDQRTAKYLRLELKRIVKQLNVTTLYITHDLIEAEELADTIALIDNGHIQHVDTPIEMLFSSQKEAVLDFLGMPNILECDSCRLTEQGLAEISCKGMNIVLPHEGTSFTKIALFPTDIYLSLEKPPGPEINRYKGIITRIQLFNSVSRIEVQVGGNLLLTELPRDILEEMDLKVGQDVFLILKLRRVRYYQAV
jgi:molybdate/tungstate transport system ATP-binding protein